MYIIQLVIRCVILAACILVVIFDPQQMEILEGWNFFRKFSPFHLLWLSWMLDMLSLSVPSAIGRVLDFVSLYSRNEPFLMGQLSFASIIFDLAVTVLALALTVYGLDRARRRGLK